MDKQLKLEIYHSTWAMERRHPEYPEWSIEEQCEMVAGAGFTGFNIDLGTPFVPSPRECRKYLVNAGLACSICAFPRSLEEVKVSLGLCEILEATSLVLNARVFPDTPFDAVDFVQQSLELGKSAGVPVQFETHRFTLTNDLLFTARLLDLCPQLELVADLSHYVVGREIPYPVDSFHRQLISRILDRSVAIQGRIANREQIQVPVHFPQHQDWVGQFYSWWREGINSWVSRAEDGDCFNFTCELGPPDYAITDGNGFEMSDRWQESLLFKQKIEAIWAQETA
jgi:hypothetical protein